MFNLGCFLFLLMSQVEKLARESFFFLRSSVPYDESSFGRLFDNTTTKKLVLVSKPISYIFNLHPPTDSEYGDYVTLLRQHLQAIC